MKALTVHPPYGSLLAWGYKQYETRSWYTSYRGQIAIHQGKNRKGLVELAKVLVTRKQRGIAPDPDDPSIDFEGLMYIAMMMQNYRKCADFPVGAILGTADLVACIRMTPDFIHKQTHKERKFGYWEVGRFAWQYANVRLFDQPIFVSGKQGLWDWDGAAAS
jgi:hypothetical protein